MYNVSGKKKLKLSQMDLKSKVSENTRVKHPEDEISGGIC